MNIINVTNETVVITEFILPVIRLINQLTLLGPIQRFQLQCNIVKVNVCADILPCLGSFF